MKTNTTVVILSAITLLFGLIFVAPRAQAQGGIPLWTNYYNGPTNTSGAANAVAVDASGNVFVTGHSPVGSGRGNDYVTIKYSNNGAPLWTNRFGFDDTDDAPVAIALDSSGNVFVTGDSLFFDGGTHGSDWVTIKYSNAGVPLWTDWYNLHWEDPQDGSTKDSLDMTSGIAVDTSGNVFVTGTSDNNTSWRNYDYVTVKYSNAGVPLWTNDYNGPGNGSDWAYALAVDGSGNVFVTGESTGVRGDRDYATIKYSSAGAPLWTNRYNGIGNGDDLAIAITTDSSGNVIVTGASDRLGDPNFAYYDFATIKYSNAGVPLWTNRFTSPTYNYAYPRAVAVDANRNVFVTGYVQHSAPYGISDFATVAYSSTGVPLWTNRYNGPANSDDAAVDIAVDSSGNVFVTGYSYGTNNNSDFATIAYSDAGVPLWTNRFRGQVDYWAQPNAVAVDGNGNVFVTGWSQTSSNGSSADFVTIKYSSVIPQPVHLTIERDGGSGYFIRYTGIPDLTYRLQRASGVNGPWSNLATNTASASGLIEYRETNPPTGAAFYRTVRP